MIFIEETTINLSETISQTINNLLNNLFSSIDNNIYSALDDITFISTDILNSNFFKSILNNSSFGLLLIANSLLLGFLIFYCIRFFCSGFINSNAESPLQFIFKTIIIALLVNYSYFFCEQIIHINSLFCLSIREIGEILFETNISFSQLVIKINQMIIIENSTLNFFSFDGILKSFFSIGLFNLLFTYSFRYILVQVLILLSPFAFLTLINNSTSWIFKSWIKCFISLLLFQFLISIILIIIFSINFKFNDVFSKLLYIGCIYSLTKVNTIIKDLFGGLSTEINSNMHVFKGLIK